MIAAAIAWIRAKLAALVALIAGGIALVGVVAWGRHWRRRARRAEQIADRARRRRIAAMLAQYRAEDALARERDDVAAAKERVAAQQAEIARTRADLITAEPGSARWEHAMGRGPKER